MPYIRIKKCVYKKKGRRRGKKKGCSSSIAKAKKYLTKLRMVDENTILEREIQIYLGEDSKKAQSLNKDPTKEVKRYLKQKIDEEYLKFDDHPQATTKKLLNTDEPAPWDH